MSINYFIKLSLKFIQKKTIFIFSLNRVFHFASVTSHMLMFASALKDLLLNICVLTYEFHLILRLFSLFWNWPKARNQFLIMNDSVNIDYHIYEKVP